MKRIGFTGALAALLLAIFAGVCYWQVPGIFGGKLTQGEIAGYLARVDKVPFPPEDKPQLLAHIRAWAEADDGKPVYMLNLMRYYESLRKYPGAPGYAGSPRASNDHYEESALPLALKQGAFAMFAGAPQGGNVMGFGPGQDGLDRVLLMRYPSRRAFLDLVTDPAYAPIAPYKLMALDVALVPMSPELVLPNLWMGTGIVLLLIFLAIGWMRAARRQALPDA
jgi:hypothetical protein